MNCAKIQVGRIDPVVSPNVVSAHSHTIVGAANIGVYANNATLFNSSCTSCEIQDDKSAYWTPQLYFAHTNGSFEEVPHAGSVVYYLGRGADQANIQPFPPGFKMLSGSSAARGYDNTTMTYGNATYPPRPIADRVSFNCLADGPPLAEQPYMFDTNCANGLRAQIHFQSCWNGIDLYKSDNSHVAYLSSIDDGICPPGYPILLVHLFMETLYSVASIDTSDGGKFLFSMGDPTGYGFHADFQNGWNQSVQTQAVENCANTDNDGQIAACPVLQNSQTGAYAEICPERPSEINEPVQGMLAKLPGCIRITPGPTAATSADMNCPANVTQPQIFQTADTTPVVTASPSPGTAFGLTGWDYVGCANDTARGIRTLNANQTDSPSMTTEYCQNFCQSNGYKYAGTEFGEECYCDNFINPSALLNQTMCYYACAGNSTEDCGGADRISLYNNTLFNPTNVSTVLPTLGAGASIPSATVSAAPLASNYLGCATDLYATTGQRALANASTATTNMTLETCASFCTTGGNYYGLYGVEYSGECYCGNALLGGSTLLPASDTSCNLRCNGNDTEVCGGSARLSVYNNTAYVAPRVVNNVGKYVTKGCLTDPNNGNGRALAGNSTRSPTLTVESCVKFCLGQSYKYAGVEYGDE
ncbi:MAG: hypothetical protein M1822_005760 [Bathelium mastoideum]|nr:MAG: hypothetical protein M1822_005760 [Bathelium mastoideum]